MQSAVSSIKFAVAPSWNEASNNSGFERIEAVVMKRCSQRSEGHSSTRL